MSISFSASLDSPRPASLFPCCLLLRSMKPVEVMVHRLGFASIMIWNLELAQRHARLIKSARTVFCRFDFNAQPNLRSSLTPVQQPPERTLDDAILCPSLCHSASVAIAARLQARTNTISNSASIFKARNLTNAAWQALAQGRCDVGVAALTTMGHGIASVLRFAQASLRSSATL